nr:zf-CCHC domain-containing protein/UBN2 domain-containing protein [Tanacetum cinerariifolium]
MVAISTSSTPPLRHCHPVPNITSSLPWPSATIRVRLDMDSERAKEGGFCFSGSQQGCVCLRVCRTAAKGGFCFAVNNDYGAFVVITDLGCLVLQSWMHSIFNRGWLFAAFYRSNRVRLGLWLTAVRRLDLETAATTGSSSLEQQDDDLKRKLAKNNEAKMVLYNALPKKEYDRVFICKMVKVILRSFLITHQGNNQLKDNKIDLLVQKYGQFTILEEECINSSFARFNTIITSLKALDEGFSSKNYIRKFLKALHPKWKAKVATTEELKELSSIALVELIGNLKVHEVVMEKNFEIYRGKKERVKSITLKAKKESSDDETLTSRRDDEEYAIVVRNFKKFFRRKCKFVRQPREEKSHFDKGMIRKERVIGNTLHAVIQILSLAIIQSLFVTKIKRPLLEVLGAIAKMKPMNKSTMKLVSSLNHQMRQLVTLLITVIMLLLLITINKSDLDTMSIDDLYNNFKIVKQEPRNQDSRSWNQESSRRTVNVEETPPKAMVTIDGVGFDWSYMAEDEFPTNMALMAFSVSESKNASKEIPNELKESLDAPLVKDRVSDTKDCSVESLVVANCNHHQRERVVLRNNYSMAGTGFSGAMTPLFETIMVQAPEYKSRRKQRKATEAPHTKPQAEESVPTPSNDPLPSGEDRLQINELMKICTKLSDMVLSLEQIKTNQAAECEKLKKRVKKLEVIEKKKRTYGLNRLYKVGLSVRVESLKKEKGLDDQTDASKQERIAEIDADEDLSLINEAAQDQGRLNEEDLLGVHDLDGDEVIVDVTTGENVEKDATIAEKEVSIVDPVKTVGEVVTIAEDVKVTTAAKTPQISKDNVILAQTLIEIKAVKLKARGIIVQEPKEEERIAREKDKANIALIEEWDNVQAIIDADKKKYFAAKRAKEIRNKPPTKAQQKSLMCTYMKNMEGYKQKDFTGKSFDAIKNMFDKGFKRVNTFVDMNTKIVDEILKKTQANITEGSSKRAGDEIEQENAKRQRLEKEDDTAELTRCLEIVPEDDFEIYEEGYKQKDFKGKSFDAIKKMFDKVYKRVNTFVDMNTEIVEESLKKTQAEVTEDCSKRAGNEIEQEMLRDRAIEATPLSSKSPTIVDYKIYKEGKKRYFRIIRADGNSQNYLTFGKMFKNFNREDLEVLRSIVKERFKKTKPVDDMDNLFMFEHHVEDNIWKYQQGAILLAVASLFFCQWELSSLAMGTSSASGNSMISKDAINHLADLDNLQSCISSKLDHLPSASSSPLEACNISSQLPDPSSKGGLSPQA